MEVRALILLLSMACDASIQAGFANAPSMQRPTRPQNGHDAVANGDESCPRADASDPLADRVAPCPGKAKP